MKNKLKNPIRGGVRALLLLVLMLVNVTQARAAEEYPIEINGQSVTSENCNDLSVLEGVSGTVKYDPETNTLTLENATIESSVPSNISRTGSLNIKVIGENHLKTSAYCINVNFIYGGTTSISGSGTLYLDGLVGISGDNIIIDGCTVSAIGRLNSGVTSYSGIIGRNSTSSTLTVRNATVTAETDENTTSGSITNFGSLVLEGCALTLPEGAAFDETLHAVALNGEIVKSKVVIEKIIADTVSYGIKIAGTEITNKNCEDLSIIPGVSGKISYSDGAKTLFLENATITAEGETEGVRNDSISNLTIIVTGENNVTAYLAAIVSAKSATIQGDGTLNANSSNHMGLFIEKDTLTIDNCTVNAIGSWGIAGSTAGAALSIKNNAKVTAEGASGSIVSLESLTLDESIVIAKPNGAAFDETLKAVALDGNVVTDQIVIDKTVTYGLKINNVSVTNANCDNLSLIPGVSGTAAYDPETKTLYLENATIIGENIVGLYNDATDSLIINVTGENTIATTEKDAITLRKLTTIQGSGTLNAESDKQVGIQLYDSSSLEIYDCSVNTKGWIGFKGYQGKESLAIHNANVTADVFGGAVSEMKSFTLDGCVITQPVGATFDEAKQSLVTKDGATVGNLTIEKIEKYGFDIAGTEVTNGNCEDLSIIPGVSGKAKYDPATKTLFLENATIAVESNTPDIDATGTDSLNINVTGENYVTSNHDAIKLGGIATLKGNGTLNIESTAGVGIYFENSLVIDSITVNAKGNWGIAGNNGSRETLTIHDATVKAVGSEGSVCDIASIAFKGSFITQPAGAAFDETLHAVALNGETVTDTVVIEKVVNYGIRLANVNVTDKNCNDLSVIPGVSGTVKYEPETKTLFLENATITADEEHGIENYLIDSLTINVTGKNNITTTDGSAINLYPNHTTINGGGTLNLESDYYCGIYFENSLVIDSCTVNAKGDWGIAGEGGEYETLTIRNATVKAVGSEGSVCDILSLTLDGTAITQPAGAAFDKNLHSVALDGETVTDTVVIENVVNYGIRLAGIYVTDKNCNDLSIIPGVSGTVKYEPETKTLFLENATIAAKGGNNGVCNDSIEGLTINVTGENSITTTDGSAIYLNQKHTTINGGGTLNLESNSCGIYFENSLVIDSCTVNAKGNWGIAGFAGSRETLTIRNANVTAEGTEGSICDILSLTLDGCKISVPADAAFDETLHSVALNGETVTDKVVITYDQAVGIKDVKAPVSAHKQGIYSIDGVYLGTDFDALPKGIYIKDGKKVKK